MRQWSYNELNELRQKHGPTFYIVDLPEFRENWTAFSGAFRNIYPNTNVAYSYKTNYLPELCAEVNDQGGFAEVVSPSEIWLAEKIGVAGHRIIVNGPWKPGSMIDATIRSGGILNVDSFQEIDFIKQISVGTDLTQARIGVRVAGLNGTEHSRFGFRDGEELDRAFRTLTQILGRPPAGLHCHVTPTKKVPEEFKNHAHRLIEISERLYKDSRPAFLNVGGGFYSKNSQTTREMFGISIPDVEEYADAIAGQFAARFGAEGPTLILEPGIAVVADCVSLITSAVATKVGRMAVAAASVYDLKPTLHNRNHPLQILAPPGSTSQSEFDIVGSTCMEHDVLHRNARGILEVDSFFVFSNVGAYSYVLRPPFINCHPAILVLDETLRVSRVADSPEEFFARFVLTGTKRG